MVSAVTSAAFVPGGEELLTGGADKTLRVWDLAGKKAPRPLATLAAAVSDVATSPNGKLAAAAGDKSATVWELADGAAVRTLDMPAAVRSLVFSR